MKAADSFIGPARELRHNMKPIYANSESTTVLGYTNWPYVIVLLIVAMRVLSEGPSPVARSSLDCAPPGTHGRRTLRVDAERAIKAPFDHNVQSEGGPMRLASACFLLASRR